MSGGATRSTLRFDDERELDVEQYAITVSGGHAWPSRFSVRAAIGVLVDGTLEGEGRRHDLAPGLVVSAGVAKQWLFGPWFVTGTAGAGVSRTTTIESELPGASRHSLVGIDIVRAGVMAGRTFGIASPYVMARGFGGPVYWHIDDMDVQGTDTSKFQLGAGTTIATDSGLSFALDVSLLGEQSASFGMSIRI